MGAETPLPEPHATAVGDRCERDGAGTPARAGCPGGRPASWVVAGVPCCSPCLASVVRLAMTRLRDARVSVWTLAGFREHHAPTRRPT
jgi:hypothetical protein